MSDAAATKSDGAEEPNNSHDAREESHGDDDGDDGDGDGSGAAATPAAGKTANVKDKHCQYCHQPFTSSSLGRHLDQYLFKKKPDGIHDVEEIRRLRSTITRRTARNSSVHQQSSNRQESPGHHETAATPTPAVGAIAPAPAADAGAGAGAGAAKASPDPHSAPPLHLNPGHKEGGYRVMLNQPSWHATGVINDIPNSSKASQFRIPSAAREPANRLSSNNNSHTPPPASHPESVRALELALQEVLDNIKAASARAQPQSSPFDFDIQSQTFPALCLHALPPPPSLFSTHPFPSPGSFPLNPPTADQHEAVRHALRSKVQQWKVEQLAAAAVAEGQGASGGTYNSSGPLPAMDPAYVDRLALEQEDLVMRQLDLSLNYWLSLPLETRRDTWQLEVTRAFARENESRKKAEEQLHRTQQEANYLRTQIEKLASCQWPREFAIFPPDMLPLSPAVARELDNKESKVNTVESSRWEYDNLIAKWKRVVMHDKSMGRVGVGSTAEPGFEPAAHGARSAGQSKNHQYGGDKNAPAPNLPGLKLPSPPRRMNPVTPDYSPRSKQRQLSASHNTTLAPHAARETADAGDSSRPPKRQRTTLDDIRPRSSGHGGADWTNEHGHHQQQQQQQTHRLPSISAASTPLSASSPYQQPSPYSGGVHHHQPYHQSFSSSAPVGIGGGDPGSHNPYQIPSAPPPNRRVEQSHGGSGPSAGAPETGGGYTGCDPNNPHRETNAHPNDAVNGPGSAGGVGHGAGAGDPAKVPGLHTLPRPGEKTTGGPGERATDGHRRSTPGSLLTLYPRSDAA